MPLNRKNGASAPKELGLFWPMQTAEGATIDVFIYASTLQSFDPDSLGPVGLLKRHRPLLETIASEKYDREGASADLLHLTKDDLSATRANEAVVDDVE
ncbi:MULTISPECIES: hypothetical protein [unclassified Rhizobium]|uniref:hypothetical protein n=1 Tax=unclassified Rhizobium TaxID=2613769 RepID=UPI0006FA9D69|nr:MULTISPECIES: hypothetical protein [unclassified Rhizobium]KQV37657.1 hypothetical protein ASC86_23835 [Rhizobium sp. Root1212]KRD34559.1 hypothetical protein ASE37_22405 [Rhizobium sp. Root268]